MNITKLASTTFFKIIVLFSILLVFYIVLIQIWKATSPDYLPNGTFDDVVREAPPVDQWGQSRRLHG